jgi:omega-6 fatty acid desaturase (delta-12 desaturase)
VLYAGGVAAALAVGPLPLRLLAGVLTGVAVTALFVWAHDAAHGALFGTGRRAEVLGTVAMLPSLQPLRLWRHGHNRVHHGFTSLVTIDWIWKPWGPAEYAAASPLARLGYRLERSVPGCAWHYLHRVWWDGMVRFRPTTPGQRRDAELSWAVTGGWLVVSAAASWAIAGPAGVVAAVLVPWLVFTWSIAFITYLHHTHPSRRFYADRSSWDPVSGHVTGSTVVHVPRPLAWLLHDIFVHTPHHLDTRVPYYRLRRAWSDLRPAVAGLGVLEYRLTPSSVRRTFAACKLFDHATATWSPWPTAGRRRTRA